MRDFVGHFGRLPVELDEEEVRGYLYFLMKEKRVFQALINQSYSAMKFSHETIQQRERNWIKVTRIEDSKKLSGLLSKEEVRFFYQSIDYLKDLAIFTTIKSVRLRISEALNLKISDIDSKRIMIQVKQFKSNKGSIYSSRQVHPGYLEALLEAPLSPAVAVPLQGPRTTPFSFYGPKDI